MDHDHVSSEQEIICKSDKFDILKEKKRVDSKIKENLFSAAL